MPYFVALMAYRVFKVALLWHMILFTTALPFFVAVDNYSLLVPATDGSLVMLLPFLLLCPLLGFTLNLVGRAISAELLYSLAHILDGLATHHSENCQKSNEQLASLRSSARNSELVSSGP